MSQNQQLEKKISALLDSSGVQFFRALPVEEMAGFRERAMERARALGKDRELCALVEQISNPRSVYPWVRTVLLFGCNMNDELSQPDRAPTEPYGRVGRWLIYLPRYSAVAREVANLLEAGGFRALWETDHYYPLRPAAVRAGLARFRRNNFVYHEQFGSWVGWWQVLTDAEFDHETLVDDIWDTDICEDCPGYCIDACPTKALSAPYTFDADRCVRRRNLAPDEVVPVDLRDGFRNWLIGCDACQEACPLNQNVPVLRRPQFARASLPPDSIFSLTGQNNFVEIVPILEQQLRPSQNIATVNMLKRNAAIILGSTRDKRGIPALIKALHDDSVTVRAHAAWALGRLDEINPLKKALRLEQDAIVQREIESALKAPMSR